MSNEIKEYLKGQMEKFEKNRRSPIQNPQQEELLEDLRMEQEEGPGFHTI